ncbi:MULTISPECIES: CPBP family intramembrane glutamic endopeptidase [unclassified Saccharicrinis]|uniref:CPBP family intramembrane glutamic endopeptidase n=1 Tax=unclassified Saccharicrinis TaxID=2646859 RepID=UPI003D3346CB
MNGSMKKKWLVAEFVLLYVGIPLFIYLDYNFTHPTMVIVPLVLIMLLILKRYHFFQLKDLVQLNLKRVKPWSHFITVVINACILVLSVYLFDHENLFNLMRSNPQMLVLLCILYPIYSAFGQEIIYRLFLFQRYRTIFKSKVLLVLVSSLSFSYMHIIYYSHVSVILTFILGVYLSITYLKTRSVLFVSILHGIYGNLIFIVGLGNYFWLDMHKFM